MDKYLSVFKISFQQEFAYRMNFIMWRIRNVLQIFIAFFLWDSVFSSPGRELFGYNRDKILTYVFGLIIVRAFVLSAKAMEVAGEVSRGELSNYLLKPINYFKYWLTRDVASKALNLIFAFFEWLLLFLVLKPPFYIQTDPINLFLFLISILLAILIYFMLLFIVSSVPFWMPEMAWGVHFLVTVIILEFLSGALFPLDILPHSLQTIINITPFPYLVFFPLSVYLGTIPYENLLSGILISVFWTVVLWFAMNIIWKKGLKVYQAYGR